MKVRQNLYIDRSVADALEQLARRPGGNKSRLVNDALTAWLRLRGAKEIDAVLGGRLDRLSRGQGRLERNVEVLLESLSQFILWEMTVTAPVPEADKAARALGLKRFEAFIADVGRRIASGQPAKSDAGEGPAA